MLNSATYKLTGLDNTKIFAAFIYKLLSNMRKKRIIIFLYGDIGSGKTTFTRFFLSFFGINSLEFEGSPTFTIVNEYSDNIYHIDLYRIHSLNELYDSGVYDYFTNNGIFLVEWPQILDFEADISITFSILNKKERKAVVCL